MNNCFVKSIIAYSLFLSCLFSSGTFALDKKQLLPIEDLQVFAEVFNLIRENYVEEVSDKELFKNAIQGMLSQLDTHSTYLDSDQLHELVDVVRGTFYGVGVEMQKDEELLVVINVIPNSPAAKAKIVEGDTIIEIDNTPTDKLTLEQAGQLLKGPDNTHVKLLLLPVDSETTLTVTLLREKITLANVETKLLEPQYAYIKIGSFQENTADKLRDVLVEYLNLPLRGIILDLRNNPGGLLTSAVDVTDLFIREGTIVYTQGRGKNSRQEFLATGTDLSKNVNMAVLINQNSASAAEIVSGALQDLKRAIIVGTTSFGKGSVQTVIPITGDRAIKLTTSLYYTPSGKTINVNGIKPDIEVDNDYSKNSDNDAQLAAALNALKGTSLQQEKTTEKFLERIE